MLKTQPIAGTELKVGKLSSLTTAWIWPLDRQSYFAPSSLLVKQTTCHKIFVVLMMGPFGARELWYRGFGTKGGRERERVAEQVSPVCVFEPSSARGALRVSQSLLQTFPASTTAAALRWEHHSCTRLLLLLAPKGDLHQQHSRLAPKRQQFWPKLNETFTKSAAGTVHQDPEPKWDFETPAIPPIEYSGHFGARVLSLA